MQQIYEFSIRVADLHHFNADPGPAFHFNADQDPAPHEGEASLRPWAKRPYSAPFSSLHAIIKDRESNLTVKEVFGVVPCI